MNFNTVAFMSILVTPRIYSFECQSIVKEECIPRSSSSPADQQQFQSKVEEIFRDLYQTKFKVFESWIIDILRRQEKHLKILKRKVADNQRNRQQKFSDLVTRVSVPRCGEGWLTFGQSCYLFKHSKRDWTTAQSVCVQLGAKLVEVETAGEDSFLIREISNQRSFSRQNALHWTGGNAIEKSGSFMWSRGRSFFSNMYTNWSPGQPDNGGEECVSFDEYGWHDYPCTWQFPFICERVMF